MLLVLTAVTLAFIWGNSLLPPEQSWAVSEAVRGALALLLPGGGQEGGTGAGGVLVRKLAHFTEFCVLGLLLKAQWAERRSTAPLLLALLAALTDETIQRYTGRTSSVLDVWLDFSGAVAGVAAAAAVLWWKGK